ncbi:MAG: hypothetical protein II849_07965 [Bacteroidales bacterium]|nr:hypothetical protein [Bacteroidales bacterium]
MKNIFKFMGIALMACSLTMVSCNKDKDDDTNTPDNPNPQPGGASIAVTWDGAAQDIQFISATIDNESLDGAPVYMIEAAKGLSNDNYVFPAFITYFINGSGDNFGHASEFRITGQDGTQRNGNAYFPTEAYINGGIEVDGNTYGDWQLENRTINSESFDATALTINANMDFVMYDFEDYNDQYNVILAAYEAGTMTLEEAQAAIGNIQTATKNMSMVITNVKPE